MYERSVFTIVYVSVRVFQSRKTELLFVNDCKVMIYRRDKTALRKENLHNKKFETMSQLIS